MGVLDGLMTMDEAVRVGILAFAFSSLYFWNLVLSIRIYQLDKGHKTRHLFEVWVNRIALFVFMLIMIHAMSIIAGIVEAKPESDGTTTCQPIMLSGAEYALEGCTEIGVE